MRWYDMRALILCIVQVLVYSVTPTTVAQEGTEASYSLEKRMFILAKTYSAMDSYFAHWNDVPTLSPDALYQEYLPKAVATSDRYKFDLLMMEFVNRLHNGHSWFRDAWLQRNYGQALGFDFRYLDGQWVVTQSSIPQLKPGDIIQQINDEQFESFYQRNKEFLTPTSDRTARNSLPTYRFLFPKMFRLQLGDGRTAQITREIPFVRETAVSGKWIVKDQVAYIRLANFGPDVDSQAIAYVRQFQNADHLIIDVRGYAGGITPEGLVNALMDRPYRYWQEATNTGAGLFKFYAQQFHQPEGKMSAPDRAYYEPFADYFEHTMLMWPARVHMPSTTVFKNNLILLVDGGCISAKEDFIVPFKDNKRAVLVGEQTAGSSGQPYFYNFDADLNLGIGTKVEYFADGSTFEGIGIEPDVKIAPSIEDLKLGRDPVLEKALALASAEQ
jgi:carboxyl-terminal processing protease